MVPWATFATRQPWWVQMALKALNSPDLGWVTTTWAASKTLPPPTGMSETLIASLADPEERVAARGVGCRCRRAAPTAGREGGCADNSHAEYSGGGDDHATIDALLRSGLVRSGERVGMAY